VPCVISAPLPTLPRLFVPLPALAFAAAVAVYAVASVPTPAHPGVAEAAIALLLLLAASARSIFAAPLGGFIGVGGFAGPLGLAMPLLVWLPLLRGVAMGWASDDVVRDVLPLAFLFLPLVFVGRLAAVARSWLCGLFCMAGLALAARFFIGVAWDGFGGRYLPLSPLVPFAILWVCGNALFGRVLWLLPATVVAPPCFAALLASGQRAAVGLCLLMLAAMLLGAARNRMGRVLVVAVALLGPAWWLGLDLLVALGALVAKWQHYGVNTRDDEWRLVLGTVARDPATLLFGLGWGAVVEIPATPGLRVSFVHSFPAYLLLKTGLLGFAALAPLLLGMWRLWAGAFRADRLSAVAAAVPMVIAFSVHTTFKFPCLGFVLALLTCGLGKESIPVVWHAIGSRAKNSPLVRIGALMDAGIWIDRPVLLPWRWPRYGVAVAALVALAVLGLTTMWLLVQPPAYTARIVVAPTMRDAAFPARILRDLPAVLRTIAPVTEDAPNDFVTFRHLLTSPELARQLPESYWHALLPDEWDAERGWHAPDSMRARLGLFTERLFGRPPWSPPGPGRIAAALDRRLVVESPGTEQLTFISLRDTDPEIAVGLLTTLQQLADRMVRQAAIARGEAQSRYLRQRLANEQNADHLEALGLLLVRQEQATMLYSIDLPFAAQVIQSATVAQRPDWPDVPLSLAVAAVAATALGIAAGLTAQAWRVRHGA
jgi:hypothetical protein